MGRLTLNVLLSFAQFEREVTAERIRDRSRHQRSVTDRGIKEEGRRATRLLGGGQEVEETEAATVRHLFRRYLEVGSVRTLAEEAEEIGLADG